MSCCGSCGGEKTEQSKEETGTDDKEQKPQTVTSSDEKQDMNEEK